MRGAEVDAGSTRDEVAGVGDEAVEVVVVGDEMEDEAAEDGAAEAVGVVEGEVIETKNVSNIISQKSVIFWSILRKLIL